jgi:hypothetical protein
MCSPKRPSPTPTIINTIGVGLLMPRARPHHAHQRERFSLVDLGASFQLLRSRARVDGFTHSQYNRAPPTMSAVAAIHWFHPPRWRRHGCADDLEAKLQQFAMDARGAPDGGFSLLIYQADSRASRDFQAYKCETLQNWADACCRRKKAKVTVSAQSSRLLSNARVLSSAIHAGGNCFHPMAALLPRVSVTSSVMS